MLTVIIASLLIWIGYRAANGCTLRNALLSVAVVVLFAMFNPVLQGLHPAAYLLAAVWLWLGVQFVLPAAEGRYVRWGWRAGRVAMAVVIA